VERVEVGRLGVAQGAERLVAAGNGRLIGLMGPNLSAAVAPQLHSSGATLLAVDTGANLIRTDEETAGVVTHSLGLWRGAVALGAWSAQQYGPRGIVLSGIIESGYDMLHAFEIGLAQAGGTPLPAIVTHLAPDPVDWTAVFQQVREARPDVVYALYNGSAAVEFLRAWRSSGLRIPLVASPFLVDESLLPLHQGRAAGLVSASSWAPGLANAANERFVAAYKEAPDAFALLGYEAGLLAAANLAAVEGPRGWIRPGPLGATRSPLYRRRVVGLTNQVVGALPALAENDPAVATLRSAIRTGWTPPYLV
jgi:ABC-type branched-subunit amino acid transport system substrate-binding protein